MTKEEALAFDLALDALETLMNGSGFAPAENIEKARKAITAIKQAQTQTVQESVVWQYRDANDDGTWSAWLGCDKRLTESTWREVRPLCTTTTNRRN